MPGTTVKEASWVRLLSVCFVSAFAALLTFMQCLHTAMLKENSGHRYSLDLYIDGEAHQPFVYRVLQPALLKAVDTVTPPAVDDWFDDLAESFVRLGAIERFGFEADEPISVSSGQFDKYPRAIIWLAIIFWGTLVAYAFTGARLFRVLFPDSRWRSIVAPLLLVVLTPLFEGPFGHIYDASVLFFMAALLLAVAQARHWTFLGLFAVACLNKETALFAMFAYAAVFFGRMPWRNYATMLALQALVFLIIYGAMRVMYADNPGSPVERWLHLQLWWYSLQPVAFFIFVGVLLAVLSYQWREKPEFLRRSCLMLVPHLVLFFVAAWPGEFRNLYESVPLLSMFLLRNLDLISRRWRGEAIAVTTTTPTTAADMAERISSRAA